MTPEDVPGLEVQVSAVVKELDRVRARIPEVGPIKRKELETKAAELESEWRGLLNQIRMAGEGAD